jgi:hypothetical protein
MVPEQEYLAGLAEAVAALVVEKLREDRDDRPLLNLNEVGQRLGVSYRSVKALVNSDKGRPPRLASVKVGDGARRVEQAALDRYVASLREDAA